MVASRIGGQAFTVERRYTGLVRPGPNLDYRRSTVLAWWLEHNQKPIHDLEFWMGDGVVRFGALLAEEAWRIFHCGSIFFDLQLLLSTSQLSSTPTYHFLLLPSSALSVDPSLPKDGCDFWVKHPIQQKDAGFSLLEYWIIVLEPN